MSDTKQATRESGGGNRRRRRSRGGQKRRRNNNQNTSGENPNNGGRARKSARSGKPPQGGGGRPRRSPMPKPPELTWWQKFLKAIGLYKPPAKPARKTRAKSGAEKSAPKSNTRVAKTADAAPQSAVADKEREPRPVKSRARSEKSGGGDSSTVKSSRVYVGNLSYEVTEQDIKELFKGIGPVRNVEIVYDRKTHRSKGFGFVEMIRVDEAKRAVEILHDQFFMGREMVVSGAKKKGQDEREDQEDTRSEAPKPVELAPLPPAAATEPDPNEKVATPTTTAETPEPETPTASTEPAESAPPEKPKPQAAGTEAEPTAQSTESNETTESTKSTEPEPEQPADAQPRQPGA